MLPGAASATAARRTVGATQLLWIYCHPYDFDPDEPFWVVPEAGRLGSRLLWYNRRRTFAKVEALLRGRRWPRRSANASWRSSRSPAPAPMA